MNKITLMNKVTFLFCLAFVSLNAIAQKTYKPMMDDNSINFYDVCKEAEDYFETHKKGKGSGWKGYQRWKNANEYKYYPDGDRSNVDPFFVQNAFQSFTQANKGKGPTDKSLFGSGWNELGPYRIDSVTGHYSAGLGRIEDLYVDPSNANTMYIGSRSGGFWKTTDGGANWQGGSTDFLMASGVNTMAVSPTNPDSILINIRNSTNGNSHGLYRSIDGGNTWTLSNFNPTNIGFGGLGSSFQIYEVRYHPRVPNLIFIGTTKGIYRSTDNLATWTLLLTSSDISEIQFHPSNDSIVYLYDNYYWGSNHNYVMRSIDQGLSYSQSNQIVANAGNRSVRLSVSSDCDDCLYFASTNGVWKSVDNGMNFTFLSNPNQSCDGFAVNDLDTTKMIYGYVDVETSSDGGQNFTRVTRWSLGNTNGAGSGNQVSFNTSTDYIHADLRMAKCINGVFYVGTDGLLSKSSDNGVTWQNLNQGTAIRENYNLGVSQSNHFRSISGSQDNGTSIKHQDTWIEFYGADGMEGFIHPLNDDWMIGSLQYGARRRTKDGGITQDGVSPSGQSGQGKGAWIAPIAYDPNNQMTVYNFGTAIFKSENFGSSWDSIGTPTSFTGIIEQAAIAENNSNIVVISKGGDIEKSIDGGVTYTSIKNNLPNYYIEDIAFDPNDDDVMIVVYSRYQNDNEKVFMTTNGGTSWTNITYNIGNMPIKSVVIDHTNASNIYLGAEIGVYTMPMNGTTWSLYNTDLPNMTVKELDIVYGSNTIKAATWGRGLWEYSLVGRNDYPAIVTTKITDQPTDETPAFGANQLVTSTISYDNTLSSVYVKWSANAPTFGNTIAMSNTTDSTWVSNSALPNQTVGTKMYFKVFAVGNAGDTSETYKFMYTVQPNCVASGTMSYQGNINLVAFDSINNPTGKTAAYSDYFDTDTTTVTTGQTYDLSVRLNTDNGNHTYHATAWIDWNNDGDFLGANETYQLGSVQNDSNALTSLSPLSITIPNNAYVGKVRMRVICLYNQVQTDPCADGFDGEVEDYGIIILTNNLTGSVTDTICNEDSLIINGTVYNAANPSGTETFNNAGANNNQDSTVTINLTVLATPTGTDTQTACDSLVWIDGNTYYTNNSTATHTVSNATGCDSIVTLSLTINNSATGTDVQTVTNTNSYTWIDGNTYTANNNTATHTITSGAANGCDSVVTLDLTFYATVPNTDVRTACDSLMWIDGMTYYTSNNTATHVLTGAAHDGSDSTVTLNLTVIYTATSTNIQAACISYVWIDGNTYTTSNSTATHTITGGAANGCDSIVDLNLTINNTSASTDAQTACDTYTWIDGNTYTTNNNTATHTLTNAAGCDSVLTLNLTINNSNSSTDVQIACDTYTWIDGNTYTTNNNTATHTLTNAAACDSVVTLNLTVNNSTSSTDAQTACDTYTWIDGNTYTTNNNTATHIVNNTVGCDSIITLDLTINYANTSTDTQTACDTYTWIDGVTYTTNNNTAIHTVLNAAGCDSVITLDLTIDVIDLTVTPAGDTLTANQGGATYQWLDCDNGNAAIAGETNSSYLPTVAGNYAVIITNGSCMDTSVCYSVNVGIEELNTNNFSIHPNPVKEMLTISATEQIMSINIYSVNGQLVKTIANPKSTINVSKLAKAMYIIEAQTNKGVWQTKFVKE